MDDELETLLVEVRANTTAFKADMDGLRSEIDTSLVDGFARAGNVLERGLTSAIRRGALGFDDLKRVAMRTLDEIASQAVSSGIADIFGSARSGVGGVLGSVLKAVFDLPGRATGGPVAPERPYWVGERGPELFVPTAAGRIEPIADTIAAAPIVPAMMPVPARATVLQAPAAAIPTPARDVRVSIAIAAPKGQDAPVSMRRSSRQIASSVRRALVQ